MVFIFHRFKEDYANSDPPILCIVEIIYYYLILWKVMNKGTVLNPTCQYWFKCERYQVLSCYY